MYGCQIPRNYQEALLLDHKNGNGNWKLEIDNEILQLE